MTALSIDDLTIQRSDQFTLHIQKLQLPAAGITCLVGPNGSGKSTLVQCAAGLLSPDKGGITIAGLPVDGNIARTKLHLGLIPDDENWLINELCASEYFQLLERVYHDAGVTSDMKSRVQAMADSLHFTALKQPLGSLSHGNKKKVQIIAGLMHKPSLIILDELRNGLDPIAIIAAENLIKQECKRGAAILAATHDLWWAERTGDRVILLSNGKIQIDQKTQAIIRKYGSVESLFVQLNSVES